MLVTSFEYEKWQREYANQGEKVQDATANGQAFAAELAVQQSSQRESVTQSDTIVDPDESTDKEASFSEKAFEYLLANRLGVDKRTLDEIKAEIEALEKERDTLVSKTSLNEAQQQRLALINDRIDVLTQLMKDLVEQASKRAAENEAKQSLTSEPALSASEQVAIEENEVLPNTELQDRKHPFGT
ncbi:hypothetical protein [Paraglaciecola sp. L1A13]|uniref:hypothetical protein n=1 Tax=Paraglaciecola sp. L1A13 TaxID=2686359 RepID=UPI001E5E422B|nr:hypothetical protein [Paraglaciecola sp. L1A13]